MDHKKRRIPIALTASVLLAANALSASAATYVNVRYGYGVSYPAALLVAERENDAGDGRGFRALQGKATMSVWAEWNNDDPDQSPENLARVAASDCAGGSVAYRLVKPSLVALSCIAHGVVIYSKTVIGKQVLATVRFKYPEAGRRRWDVVVKSVAASLHLNTPGR